MRRNSRKRKATTVDIPSSPHSHHSATLSPRSHHNFAHHGLPPLRLDNNLLLGEDDYEDDDAIEKIWSHVDTSLAPIDLQYIKTLEYLRSQPLPNLDLGSRGRFYLEIEQEAQYVASKSGNTFLTRSSKKQSIVTSRRNHRRDSNAADEALVIDTVVQDGLQDLVYGYEDDSHLRWRDDMEAAVHDAAFNHHQSSKKKRHSSVKKRLWTDSHIAAPSASNVLLPEDLVLSPPEPPVPVGSWHPASWGTSFRLDDITDYDATAHHPASVTSNSIYARWEWEAQGYEPRGYYGKQSTADDQDEISHEIKTLASALSSVSRVNRETLSELISLGNVQAHVQSIIDRESQMAASLESYYRLLFPEEHPERRYFRVRSTPRDIVAYVTRHATTQSAAVIAHATSFALTLSLGDAVDVLDRNGLWNSGVVVDLQKDGGRFLRYVKIHFCLWGSECDEWISTFGGRILPAGMCVMNSSSSITSEKDNDEESKESVENPDVVDSSR